MGIKTISLVGEVNDDMFDTLLQGLLTTEERRPVRLIINTTGGADQIGLAMFDLIKQRNGKVFGEVFGACYSAGTLLLLACEHRACSENAEFLFHYGSGEHGGAQDIQANIRRARVWEALVAESTGQPLTRVMKWHRNETYMDASQALKNNIVDTIVGRKGRE